MLRYFQDTVIIQEQKKQKKNCVHITPQTTPKYFPKFKME